MNSTPHLDTPQDGLHSNFAINDEGRSQDTLNVQTALPGICILGERQVRELTNLSRTTRWRMERRGEFPKRVRLSPGRVGWRQDEIRDWIDSRTSAMPSPMEMQQRFRKPK